MKVLHIQSVIRVIGYLLLVEAFFMLIATLVSVGYQENFWPLLFSMIITSVSGGLCIVCCPEKKPMGKREGYLIVATIWVVFSLFGLIPYYIGNYIPSFTDAFFEAISGFTASGSSTIADVEALPNGILFWRTLCQWVGGMGIILLSLAIIPMVSDGSMSLLAAEITGPTKEKVHAKVAQTAKTIWGIYVALSLIEAALLWVAGMEPFDAICHAFSTISTGGLSTKNNGLMYWDSAAIDYIITFFMFVGGINFSLIYLFLKGKFSKLLKNEEFLWYTASIVVFALIIMGSLVVLHQENSFADSIRYALFNMSSIISSTGFSHIDYTQWSPLIWSIMLFAMLLGGCSGSTSGGIKTVRIVLLLKNTYHEFQRLLHPNAVIPVRFNGHVVNTQIINNVLAFIFMYVIVMGISIIVFTATGLGFDESVGTTFAALTNVGLGMGEIGTGDYSTLTDFAKWYMSFLMLIGRLELFTVLIVLTPAFWRR